MNLVSLVTNDTEVALLLVGFGRLFEALMTKPTGFGFGGTKY
jgi:hypothetical protein